ncbi:MAG: twin transmembrane helix small protein [Pseudomonadota bacterium]
MFTDVFSILLFLVLIATLLTLVLGIVSMFRAKPSKDQGEKSNRLMRWRVLLQALALLILAMLLFFKR